MPSSKKQIAWKVVTVYENEFVSAIVSGKAQIKYEIGKNTVTPEWLRKLNRYPHLFNDPETALISLPLLATYLYRAHILKCECKNEVIVNSLLDPYSLEHGTATHNEMPIMQGLVSYKIIKPVEAYSVYELAMLHGFSDIVFDNGVLQYELTAYCNVTDNPYIKFETGETIRMIGKNGTVLVVG